MALQSKACTARTDDPSLGLSTHMSNSQLPVPGESNDLFWPPKVPSLTCSDIQIIFKKEVLKGLGIGYPVYHNTCHYHRFMKGARAGDQGRALCSGTVVHGQLITPPFSVCSLEAECRSIHAPNRLFVHTFCGLAILTPWESSSSNEWSR